MKAHLRQSWTYRLTATLSVLLLGGAIFFFQNCGKPIKHVELVEAENQDLGLQGLINSARAQVGSTSPKSWVVTADGYVIEPEQPDYKAGVRIEVLDPSTKAIICSHESRADLESTEAPGHGFEIGCQGLSDLTTVRVVILGRRSGENQFRMVDVREVQAIE